MAFHSHSLTLNSEDETTCFAQAIAARARPGFTLLLDGPVGAGKTHFARAFIKSLLDEDEDVPSPTFTLVQTYETRAGPVWHADLYRLSSGLEIEELGLTEAMDDAICLIEWPDRLGPLTPDHAILITWTVNDPERRITLTWTDEKWTSVIEDLTNE